VATKVGGAAVGGLVTCATGVMVMQPEAANRTAIANGIDRNLVCSALALSMPDNGQFIDR